MTRETALLALALTAAAIHGCRIEREVGAGDSVHPAGFEDPEAPAFHGDYLREWGYPLAGCRECHGEDYRGGAVEVTCASSSCHAEGVDACDTCHAAQPETGSHFAHGAVGVACWTCHPERTDARTAAHPGGQVELQFSDLATAHGSFPRFDSTTKSCTSTYCHGSGTPSWGDPGPLDCDACHEAIPGTHARYATIASDCTSCHVADGAHINGTIDVNDLGCDGCHGKGPLGAPPAGLLGMNGPAVGAHARHLDGSIADRMSKPARCQSCHVVPETIDAPGHLDLAAPADVRLGADETYDPTTLTCTVGCHWDRDPGPRWDDDSGAARSCTACHAMPPPKTRDGGPHPPSEPTLATCLGCHTFDASTHVDGQVDFQ